MQELKAFRNVLWNLTDDEKETANKFIKNTIAVSFITFLVLVGLLVIIAIQSVNFFYSPVVWFFVFALVMMCIESITMRQIYEKENQKLPMSLRLVTAFYTVISLGFFNVISELRYNSIEKIIIRKINKKHKKEYKLSEMQYNTKELVYAAYDYRDGTNGYEMNESLAIKLFEKAAELNHTTALLELGFHASDLGQYQKAFAYYQRAFDLGESRGAYFIARLIEKGQGFKANQLDALNWYYKAAQKGESLSQYYIGIEYIKGIYVTKDVQKGLEYLKKSAEQNEYDALFYLGVYYLDPGKNDINEELAMNYLLKASEHAENDEEKAEALNELGRYYLNLWQKNQKEEDHDKGLSYTQEAAKLGNEHAISNLNLLSKQHLAYFTSPQTIVNNHQQELKKMTDNNEALETVTQENHYEINVNTSTQSKVNHTELKQLATSMIIFNIFKLGCFIAGIIIIIWARNNATSLSILLPFTFVLGIVVAGLPSIPKSFGSSYQYNKKWDRIFKTPEYKATVDYDRKNNPCKEKR